jgi:integrase
MQYMNEDELRRFFTVLYNGGNRKHRLVFLMCLWHALRISEAINVLAKDVQDGLLSVQRKKGSNKTVQEVHIDSNPIFDCSEVLTLAASLPPEARLFPMCRQRCDVLVKGYGKLAGIHPAKLHSHVFKHSICMLIFGQSHSVGEVQQFAGHKSVSSSLQYLRSVEHTAAQKTVSAIQL